MLHLGCDNRPAVPFDNDLARGVLHQCQDAGVPCYIKQIRDERNRVVHHPHLFPEDLRVRELPWTLRTKTP